MNKLYLSVVAEGDEHPYCDAVVTFYEHSSTVTTEKWKLRGRFDGYESIQGKLTGYVKLPVEGFETNVHEGKSVGELHTEFPAQDKKRLRVIWQILQDKGFVVEEIVEKDIAPVIDTGTISISGSVY